MPRRVGQGVLDKTPRVDFHRIDPYTEGDEKKEQASYAGLELGQSLKDVTEPIKMRNDTEIQRIELNNTNHIDIQNLTETMTTLLMIIYFKKFTNYTDNSTTKGNSVVVFNKKIRHELTRDSHMWIQVMSKHISVAKFEEKYWNSVREYTNSKNFGKYINDERKIKLSKELHAMWQLNLKVYSANPNTTAISLNNAVMTFVINVENLKTMIDYFFSMLSKVLPTEILPSIQKVLEYEKRYQLTLKARLIANQPPAWTPEGNNTDNTSRFKEMQDDTKTSPHKLQITLPPPPPSQPAMTTPGKTQEPDSENSFTRDKDTTGDRAKARETESLERKTTTTNPRKDQQAFMRALREHDQGPDRAGPYVCW